MLQDDSENNDDDDKLLQGLYLKMQVRIVINYWKIMSSEFSEIKGAPEEYVQCHS